MTHVSLYRKYRPQTFDDVVGQQHITRTLRNALREGAVAHAYLFCGPRGTGKTTTARVLAKALLCENGPTPDPDDTCEQCREITEGRHPDVYELDAASRSGVENVREEIVGRVSLGASRGRVKVYIIDEVHMLSKPAFNALLKTLEEPPSHVHFVLCTTDPHKVIDTVQSRCQRFDFHRIGIEDIAARLGHIAAAEGIEVADGSLLMIARHAAGGMRDAITMFEQLVSFTGKSIALSDVEGLLGEVDRSLLFDLSGMVARRDVAGGFRFVAQLAESGVDIAEFVRELVGHYRDLYVTSVVGDPSGIVDATSEELGKLAGQAREYGPDRLARVLDVLGELAAELRWSSDPRLSLEVGLARLARPQGEVSLEAVLERLDAVERGMPATAPAYVPAPVVQAAPVAPRPAAPAAPAPAPAEPAPAPGPAPAPEPSPSPVVAPAAASAPAAAPAGGARLDRAQVKRAWPHVVEEIKRIKRARASWYVSVEVDVDPDGETLRIEFPADQEITKSMAEKPDAVAMLREALTKVLGTAPPFRFQVGRGAGRPVQHIEPEHDPDADPLEILGGEVIEHAPAGAEAAEPETPPAPAPDAALSLLDSLGAEVIAEVPNDSIDVPEEDEEI